MPKRGDGCENISFKNYKSFQILYYTFWLWIILKLPLFDELVDVMMSRDSDSHIIDRELAAVQEWVDSKEHTFHIMRDHPYHCIDILGGITFCRISTWKLRQIRSLFLRNVGCKIASKSYSCQNSCRAHVKRDCSQAKLRLRSRIAEIFHMAYCWIWFRDIYSWSNVN